jgi:sulfite dehydrogenase
MRRLAAVCLAASLLAAGCGGEDDENGASGSDRGRTLFTSQAEPACGSCHTLADADTSGTIGPNLDELQPTADRVQRAMSEGPGAMPRYDESLTDEDIAAVAEYVETAAGG